MDIRLIHLFKVAVADGPKVDKIKVASEAASRGFIVHPDCCTKSVLEYVRSQELNPNSTFYKTWEDVTSKSRLELYIDQLLHYASTYGTNHEGEVYCPNGEPISVNYKSFQVIRFVTPKQLFDRCVEMASGKVALSPDVVDTLANFIVHGVKKLHYPLNLDEVGNRDLMVRLSVDLGMLPTIGENIVRVLYYKLFGTTSMIMSKQVLYQLYQDGLGSNRKVNLTKLTDDQLKELARVFHRYKKFLLALKDNRVNRPVINKVSKMAKTYHQPMKVGFWESFTNKDEVSRSELMEEIRKLDNNFKIVRLLHMFRTRQLQNETGSNRIYTIRNGKLWVDHRGGLAPYDKNWSQVSAELLYKLCSNIQEKWSTQYNEPIYIKFPDKYELACPMSERMFVGDVPFGTYINLADKNNYFGVYWRNEWGTTDYDLSYITVNGSKIGWNGDYEWGNMIYSGDMTTAKPEATEMILVRGDVFNGCVYLNRYCGDRGSQYRLFVGSDECRDFSKNYMVDPNTIFLKADGTSDSKETMIGCTHQNKFYFYKVETGDRMASELSDSDTTRALIDYASAALPLKLVLLGAGAIEYTDEHARKGIEPTIDLTKANRDTLINLFS